MEALAGPAPGQPADTQHPHPEHLLLESEEGFEELVRRHQKQVFRVLVGWTGDESLADNLTQDVFLRAFKARQSFRGDAAVSTWLHRIAVRVAQDHDKNRRAGFWRRLIRWPESADAVPDPVDRSPRAASPERLALARESADRVRAAAETLPEKQRAVFQLRFIEEMALADIAEVLDVRVGTVKTQLHRAVRAVRRELSDEEV